jgi:phenylpropionate dioxygenase-like ring-hydroxylating dioxygenase large terminal subunit
VYINPDLSAEPLTQYLAPMPEFVNPFEFEKMRYRWYVSVKLPCNWKVALEAFNEGYHVAATHPQLLDTMGDDVTRSFVFGRHGMFAYPTATRPWGAPSPRTGKPMPEDLRPGLIGFFDEMNQTLRAIYSERDAEASRHLLHTLEPTSDPMKLIPALLAAQRAAAIQAGAGWPEISLEQLGKAGVNWHVFPNQVFLMYPDGALVYRARPNGDDPDSCIYDITALQRYAPGAEPRLDRKCFHGNDDWKNFRQVSIILQQDFDNMEEVQKGMKSDAFVGARTNPKQETSISNLHRHIVELIYGPCGRK